MLDQNTFIETVQSVAEIIRTSAEPIGRDEIMSYFKDMELNKAQEDMASIESPSEYITLFNAAFSDDSSPCNSSCDSAS